MPQDTTYYGIVAGLGALLGAGLPIVLNFILARKKADNDQNNKDRETISSEYKQMITDLQSRFTKIQDEVRDLQIQNIKCAIESEALRGELKIMSARLSLMRSTKNDVADAVIITDSKGNILQWNQPALYLFRYAAVEAVSRNIFDLLVDEKKREHFKKPYDDILKGGSHCSGVPVVVILRNKDGDEFPADLALMAWESDGEWRFVSSIHRNYV